MKLFANIPLGQLEGLGNIGGEGPVDLAGTDVARYSFQDTISLAIGVMTVVGFIWFFFLIVTAAITWLSSGGEKNKIQQAQKQITNAVIGLIILISATLLIKVVEFILGIKILSGITDILKGL